MRWFLLALLGIVIAAGVSVAASSLAGQQIGLASQPISAGDALAPRQSDEPKRPGVHARHRSLRKTTPSSPTPRPEPTSETTAPAPVTPAPRAPSSHEGDGGGGGADD